MPVLVVRRPPLLCRRHLQIPFRSNIQAGSTVYVGQTGAVPGHHLEICGYHWYYWVSPKRPFFSFPRQTSITSTVNLVGALWYTCHTTGCRINRNDMFIFWIFRRYRVYGANFLFVNYALIIVYFWVCCVNDVSVQTSVYLTL